MTRRLATYVALLAGALLSSSARGYDAPDGQRPIVRAPRSPSVIRSVTALRPHNALSLAQRTRLERLPTFTTTLSTGVHRVCNISTLSSVAETGMRVAQHVNVADDDLRRVHRVSNRLRVGTRLGRAAGSFGRTVSKVARVTKPFARLANTVFGLSSVALIVDAGVRLHKTPRDNETHLSATRDLGAGISGLGRLGYFMRPLSAKLGLIGGCMQAGVGACNIYRGVRQGNRDLLVSGALDLCGGTLFVAGSCAIGEPYVSFAAASFTAGRMLYDNRTAVKAAVVGAWGKLRGKLSSIATRLSRQPTPTPSAPSAF